MLSYAEWVDLNWNSLKRDYKNYLESRNQLVYLRNYPAQTMESFCENEYKSMQVAR